MVLDFGLINSGLFPSSSAEGQGLDAEVTTQIIWRDVGIGIVPIGSVVAWLKSIHADIPPLLPNYVECNGQVLDDGDSPINGITVPDLNASSGTARFLRGGTASGAEAGSETHRHTTAIPGDAGGAVGSGNPGNAGTYNSSLVGTLPSYHTVVWIMRIK